MTETEEFKSLRRLALASLGRNLLHFQRVESLLKQLVLICDFGAPTSQFATQHADRKEELRTTTMGNLVNELHRRLYGKPPEPETEQALTETFIRVGFKVDADPDYIARQKRHLEALVLERNNLIHHDLAEFDPNSEESCRCWIARLDEQNLRIIAQHEALRRVLDTRTRLLSDAAAFMNSEDGDCLSQPRPDR